MDYFTLTACISLVLIVILDWIEALYVHYLCGVLSSVVFLYSFIYCM